MGRLGKKFFISWVFLLLAVGTAFAQEKVRFSLDVQPAAAPPEGRFELILGAKVSPGWHLYSLTQPEGGPIATEISLEHPAQVAQAGPIAQPVVRKVYDENFEMDAEYLDGDVEFLIPMRVSKGAAAGKIDIAASVRFMTCSETMCLPPQTRTLSAAFRISASSKSQASAKAQASQPSIDFSAPASKIAFVLRHEGDALAPGRYSEVSLDVEVNPGWHLYSMTQPEGGPVPTTLEIAGNPSFEVAGDIRQPPIRTLYDENFEMNAEYIDSGSFIIPFRVLDKVPDGRHRLQVKIRYMACSDTMCLPPQDRTFETAIVVAEGGTGGSSQAPTLTAKPAQSSASQPSGRDGQEASESALVGNEIPTTFLAYLGFSFAMGALALLTPCVFPMIPITVSYFTKRESRSRGQALRDAGLYAVGIVFTFTALGFLLTMILGAGGINRIAASPAVNLLIATVFVVFALSLFGVLELRLPSSWINAIDKKGTASGGWIGILLMALTFSLTSFTCTVPFVGTVMVAALQGEWVWSLLGVTSFATAFALPFFVLAVFPSWLKSLPRSGGWMDSMKIVMGFVELAAALKFISNIDLVYSWEFLTRPVFITIWVAIAAVTAVYLLGWFRFSHEMASETVGAGRVLSAIFFASVSLYLVRGLFCAPLGELDSFLPPRDYGGAQLWCSIGGFQSSGGSEQAVWGDDYQAALKQAQREEKPILIDFTGYTCTNCRWMEENMFVKPEIQSLFAKMVLVRLYTDGRKEVHRLNQQFERDRFETIALPFYAIMSGDDRILATFGGLTRDPEKFAAFLQKGIEGGSSGERLVFNREAGD